jgi:predicted nucleic acid-binding protein
MRVILDTGPWVALIDRSESRHKECVDWFRHFKGEIYSSEAVLTEVLYLLNFSFPAQSAALDFVLNGAVILVPSGVKSLLAVKKLMEKYEDLPMDFADATLVGIAQDLGIYDAVTFDKRHFVSYRVGKKSFSVVPGQ